MSRVLAGVVIGAVVTMAAAFWANVPWLGTVLIGLALPGGAAAVGLVGVHSDAVRWVALGINGVIYSVLVPVVAQWVTRRRGRRNAMRETSR
jgi:hypothetical protein